MTYPTIRRASDSQVIAKWDSLRGVALPFARRSTLLPHLRDVARVQAGYYLLTGIWPLLSRGTFEAITGRKQDFWLVQTVGALVGVTGAALAAAARDQRSLQSHVDAADWAARVNGSTSPVATSMSTRWCPRSATVRARWVGRLASR